MQNPTQLVQDDPTVISDEQDSSHNLDPLATVANNLVQICRLSGDYPREKKSKKRRKED